MARFSPSALRTCIESRLRRPGGAALCVAYSGGLDSTVLLHALARIAEDDPRYRLRAIHVDHQLHEDSAHWREHCAQVARVLAVEWVPLTVRVSREERMGLEAAARAARYDAMRPLVQPDEVLLTAHHADDQLETVLLALMRGAGLRGLSGMPPLQPFGAGWLLRPLLEFTRAELQAWAESEQLQWLTDPTNQNTDLDRNHLRHRVVTALRERWPAAARTATRSAEHLAEAGDVLESLAQADAATLAAGACLKVEGLRALEPARRRNVLRHWIRQHGLRAPSTRKLAAIEHDMLAARQDRVPCTEWGDAEVRRHRGLLYCGRRQPPFRASDVLEWDTGQPLALPAQLGVLRLEQATSGGVRAIVLAQRLRIRFRSGGESLQPSADAHHRKLKKLLQSTGVLPWWRERVPLVYAGDRLVAVGDLWVAQEFAASAGEPAVRVVWERRPEIEAVGG